MKGHGLGEKMVKNDKQRGQELEGHKKSLAERTDAIFDAKGKLKHINEYTKVISEELEKQKVVTDKEVEVVELIDSSKIGALSEDMWQAYNEQLGDNKQILENLHRLNSGLDSVEGSIGSLDSLTISTSSMTLSGTVAIAFSNFLEQSSDFYSAVDELKKLDCTPKHIERIQSFLMKECSHLVKAFKDIIGNWGLAPDETSRMKYLLGLRTLIFEQIFGNIHAIQPEWQRAPWFEGREGHFAQAKFFILGVRAKSDILNIDMLTVDNVSNNLEDCFNNLTNLGKAKPSLPSFETSYRRTLANLASAIELRARLHRAK